MANKYKSNKSSCSYSPHWLEITISVGGGLQMNLWVTDLCLYFVLNSSNWMN